MFWAFISVLGGLSLFLFGVKACCSVQKLGGGLYNVLLKLARGRVRPFFFGTLLTLIAQNSTVATSLAIGLVDIGVMNLNGAIMAMSGASFGGGLVILLISLNVIRLGPLLLFISLLMIRLFQKTELRNYGYVLQGVSLIFFGMLVIQDSVVPMIQDPRMRSLILWGSQNCFLMGALAFFLTSLIQNNTVVVAIAISVASAGLLDADSALAVVLGAHVGSTTIILLSGLGGRLNSRRLGLATILYKLLGALFVALLAPLVLLLVRKQGFSVATSLPLFQVVLATLNVLLAMPFLYPIRRICEAVFPSLGDPGEPIYLNRDVIDAPALALTLLSRETTRLANFLEAFLQILLTIPSERQRLPRLRRNLKNLNRECLDFFSCLSLPQKQPLLRRQYIDLSVALSSISEIVACIDQDPAHIQKRLSFENPMFGKLTDQVLTIVRLAFRFFAIGDENVEKSARAEVARFRRTESRLRFSLACDDEDDQGDLWQLLPVFVSITRSAERILESVKVSDFSYLTPARGEQWSEAHVSVEPVRP